ncbi:MAG: PilZ domain-containing protein [Gemmataceae bacterium]|nr:PilZ domain-containing protein [Gemmataceae bacterium]
MNFPSLDTQFGPLSPQEVNWMVAVLFVAMTIVALMIPTSRRRRSTRPRRVADRANARRRSGLISNPASATPVRRSKVTSVAPSEASERRAMPDRNLERCSVHRPVSIYVTGGRWPGARILAWVQERSEQGLGILLNEAVEPKAILHVCPANAPQSTGWVDVEVRHCRKSGGAYHVGCSFLKPPPSNVMLLLG